MTLEQYRAEASRLKKEIKNLNASRVSLTDPEEIESARAQVHKLQVEYNEVLQKLKEIKDDYEWKRSVDREFSAYSKKES
jgi:chromosome segregation ATPase